jgi:16S rRNA (cytosine967-C5)-methyltransferase
LASARLANRHAQTELSPIADQQVRNVTQSPSRAGAPRPEWSGAAAAARAQATLDLLHDADRSARPVDAVTAAYFRTHAPIQDADRGALLDQLHAVLRHRARLGWWLDTAGVARMTAAQPAAGLAGAGRRPYARPGGTPFCRGKTALSGPEQALLRRLAGWRADHPDMPEDLRLECPDWAADPLRQRFGAAFATEMAATLTPPPLDLRVNPLKATRAAVLRALKGQGVRAEATRLAPQGIRIRERLSLARLPGLKTGVIEIQDEGSQLVALLVDAQPGRAGGRFLCRGRRQDAGHRGADAEPGASCRLRRQRGPAEALRRAFAARRLQNAETRLLTSETDRWIKRHKGRFDRVLVDAPCSGTGTWRRNPDARWRAPDLGLPALVALQARILASAARLVKPGGRLVYATCSLLPEENEHQGGLP